MNKGSKTSAKQNFFVSYNKADKKWAEWVAWTLEAAGYTTFFQAWDFVPGSNFVLEMQKAATESDHTLAILSDAYLNAEFTQPEWAAAFARDPRGENRALIPIRVTECEPEGILKPVVYIDLVGLVEASAERSLLDSVMAACGKGRTNRRKPVVKPLFPSVTDGSRPTFPTSGYGRVARSRLPSTGRGLIGRRQTLNMLWRMWDNPQVAIVTIVAPGGFGKTQVVKVWREAFVAELRTAKSRDSMDAATRRTGYRPDVRGDEWVFDWSFFSDTQGSRSGSAEPFFNEALQFFGGDPVQFLDAEGKGQRLAELLTECRALLILDGLESLQIPPGGGDGGKLLHPGMRTFLMALADRPAGLCIITSRSPIADLEFSQKAAGRIELKGLEPKDGEELLKGLAVKGTKSEFRKASNEVMGNPQLLTLLGTLLRNGYQGLIESRHKIDHVDGNELEGLLLSYESWVSGDPSCIGQAAVSILRILSLFDRPATGHDLLALRCATAIPNLTDKVVGLSEEQWYRAVQLLRDWCLIDLIETPEGGPAGLDIHGLVRRHYSSQLKKQAPYAWRSGHYVLYKHFLTSGLACVEASAGQPSLANLMPFYRAVYHGCAADHHTAVLRDVFKKEIRRYDEHYSFFRLGAAIMDLDALGHFCVGDSCTRLLVESSRPRLLAGVTWPVDVLPHESLSLSDQAYVLNELGSALRFLGLPLRARPLIKSAFQIRRKTGDSTLVGRTARNLAKVCLQSGELEEAKHYAEEAVSLVKVSGVPVELFISFATLGRVLHCMGDWAKAVAQFRQSFKCHQLQNRFTLQESHYCDLLIEFGRTKVAVDLFKRFLVAPDVQTDVLDYGLYYYAAGRIQLVQDNLSEAREYLNIAVQALERANRRDELGAALLLRAAMQRKAGNAVQAKRDVDSAYSIANRGMMQPLLADCFIEYARLAQARGDTRQLGTSLEQATRIVETLKYLRRKPEIEEFI